MISVLSIYLLNCTKTDNKKLVRVRNEYVKDLLISYGVNEYVKQTLTIYYKVLDY